MIGQMGEGQPIDGGLQKLGWNKNCPFMVGLSPRLISSRLLESNDETFNGEVFSFFHEMPMYELFAGTNEDMCSPSLYFGGRKRQMQQASRKTSLLAITTNNRNLGAS